MALIDVNAVEKELKDEINRDAVERAKSRMKSKLIAIDSARTVLRNLEREYQDLISTIGEEGS